MSSKKVQIVGGIIPPSDWNQTDETQADYIKNKPIVDQAYSAESPNAQSGKAVAEAVTGIAESIVDEAVDKVLQEAKESGEFDGAPGKDGVGIQTTIIDEAGNLKVVYSDGNVQVSGKVVGEDGKSAYQSAKEGGYTGSEVEFNTDLATVGPELNTLGGRVTTLEESIPQIQIITWEGDD